MADAIDVFVWMTVEIVTIVWISPNSGARTLNEENVDKGHAFTIVKHKIVPENDQQARKIVRIFIKCRFDAVFRLKMGFR